MYILKIKDIETNNEREYKLLSNLRVILNIQNAFNKKAFVSIMQEIEEAPIEDIVKILKCGLIDDNEKEQLEEDIYNNLGFVELYNILGEYLEELQYPGKSEKEKKSLIKKQIEKQKEIEKITMK